MNRAITNFRNELQSHYAESERRRRQPRAIRKAEDRAAALYAKGDTMGAFKMHEVAAELRGRLRCDSAAD